MNKICTDINQSKKLIELGIDLATADMWYPPSLIEYGVVKKWWENPTIVKDIECSNFKKEYYIPCWSLAALLRVLPYPELREQYNGNWTCKVSNANTTFLWEDDNPVDACVKMIEKLHEQKLL